MLFWWDAASNNAVLMGCGPHQNRIIWAHTPSKPHYLRPHPIKIALFEPTPHQTSIICAHTPSVASSNSDFFWCGIKLVVEGPPSFKHKEGNDLSLWGWCWLTTWDEVTACLMILERVTGYSRKSGCSPIPCGKMPHLLSLWIVNCSNKTLKRHERLGTCDCDFFLSFALFPHITLLPLSLIACLSLG